MAKWTCKRCGDFDTPYDPYDEICRDCATLILNNKGKHNRVSTESLLVIKRFCLLVLLVFPAVLLGAFLKNEKVSFIVLVLCVIAFVFLIDWRHSCQVCGVKEEPDSEGFCLNCKLPFFK